MEKHNFDNLTEGVAQITNAQDGALGGHHPEGVVSPKPYVPGP